MFGSAGSYPTGSYAENPFPPIPRDEGRLYRDDFGSPNTGLGVSTADEGSDTLGSYLNDLRETSDDARLQAAKNLRIYVEAEAREMSRGTFSNFVSETTKRISTLVGSSEPQAQAGGIMAIDELIEVPCEDNDAKILSFAKSLRPIFESDECKTETLILASRTFGHVARSGGYAISSFVREEITSSLNCLKRDATEVGSGHFSAKLHVACLVLKEAAANAPNIFVLFLQEFLEHIWVAAFFHSEDDDSSKEVRLAAVGAVRAALSVMSTSTEESEDAANWFHQLALRLDAGLKQDSTAASVHGALLIVGELLRNSSNFMHPRFGETCQTVLDLHKHEDVLVQETVISLLPKLARFKPVMFSRDFLDRSMSFLLAVLRDGERRDHHPLALYSVGELASAVGRSVSDHADEILQYIGTTLAPTQSSGRKQSFQSDEDDQSQEALRCVSKLAKAVGPGLASQIERLVDQIFSAGLSQSLLDLLSELAYSTPTLMPAMQHRLLSCVSSVLGDPVVASMTASTAEKETALLLAFQALQKFGLGDVRARSLLDTAVLCYFDHESSPVRRSAALTATKLILPEPSHLAVVDSTRRRRSLQSPTGLVPGLVLCQEHQLTSLALILQKTLSLCISDPQPKNRGDILDSLDSRFDPFLCDPKCVTLLAQATHDESLHVRESVAMILGRLLQHNPAYIMPPLRRLLMQLLTELEYLAIPQGEDATQLLSSLAVHAPTFVEPYMCQVMQCVLKRLHHAMNVGALKLVGLLLESIGHLSEVSGQEMKPFLDQVLPLLVQIIQDQGRGASNLKREQLQQAYLALCKIVGNTGYSGDFHDKYPSLLPFLISVLRSDVHAVEKQQRQLLLRCLGTLGALEPKRFQKLTAAANSAPTNTAGGGGSVAQGLIEGQHWITSLELRRRRGVQRVAGEPDPFAPPALDCLLRMLDDPTLEAHYSLALEVMTKICKLPGKDSFHFLQKVIWALARHVPILETSAKHKLIRILAELVRTRRSEMSPYVQDIFHIVSLVWFDARKTPSAERDDLNVISAVLALLEEMSRCHYDSLKVHLGPFVPSILALLQLGDRPDQQAIARQVLRSLVGFGQVLGDSLHVVIPALVRCCYDEDLPSMNANPDTRSSTVKECAVRALGELSSVLCFPHLLGRVMHPLLRILESKQSPQELVQVTMETLELLASNYEREFEVFSAQVRRTHASRNAIGSASATVNSTPVSLPISLPPSTATLPLLPGAPPSEAPRSVVNHQGSTVFSELTGAVGDPAAADEEFNQQSLMQACDAKHPNTKEEWTVWMHRFTMELLKQSASPALKACWSVAQDYPGLARDLFQASFVCCWLRLHDTYQDQLVKSLETALVSPTLPPDILQVLLNMVELLDRCGLCLPIDARTLGELAEKCHAYAKALQYKEREYVTAPAACVEALIAINTQLQQAEAAQGVLINARKYLNVELREPWYERLRRWEDALEAYELRQLEDPTSTKWTRSRLRCLHELGEWPRLSDLAQHVWDSEDPLPEAVKLEVAPLAAAAEFHLRNWDRMGVFVDALEGSHSSSYEGFLYSAILAIHRQNYSSASDLISRAREILEPELIALVGESYTRAYGSLIKVQQLTELEEIIKYKTTDREVTRVALRELWTSRLYGCKPTVEVWQAALEIRSVVLPPQEDLPTWLRFCALCRKGSRLDLAVKAVEQLRSDSHDIHVFEAHEPMVVVAHAKNLHAAGCKQQAYETMRDFLATMSAKLPKSLLSKCYLKMGTWTKEVFEDEHKVPFVTKEDVLKGVLGWLKSAVDLHSDYKVWNALALAHFQAATSINNNSTTSPGETLSPHILPAIDGFVKSVVLSPRPALQDILRLLTLWFNYAGNAAVDPALDKVFEQTPVQAWLQVGPQILARLRSPNTRLRQMIQDLFSRLAQQYPQAVVFPLTVASKSSVNEVSESAKEILEKMRKNGSEKLVSESETVSEELIRISILCHEQWCEALEEASRYYHNENERDIDAMLGVLLPLHQKMNSNPPCTMREIAFQRDSARDLNEAFRCLEKYTTSIPQVSDHMKSNYLESAWKSYGKVFRRFDEQVRGLTHLDMQSVSPRLLTMRRLELAIPGTYNAEEPHKVVTIAHFSPSIEVVPSKQRPRILQLHGSDGRVYQFLLKGHEDLKQDERVMQLFSLINSLLAEKEAAVGDLSITRFAVVPLSANSGLIEWVPRCDTVHQLIKMYRKFRNVELSVEYQLMKAVCSKCEDLNFLQRVEVLRNALTKTSGWDLRRVLWLQSKNSEVWLSRRTTYCRSLAVMSVVGYILGLGDRHPSNLMIARETGQVVHIDFGDCFEIAAYREKFPERIPFRLTRMLLHALEISGVEGNYRYTCEMVMGLLRDNKDTVMAMLEAFVFDPLITWRLLPAWTRRRQQGAYQPNSGWDGNSSGGGGSAVGANAGTDGGRPLIGEARETRERIENDPHLVSTSVRQARQRELRQNLGPEGVGASPELLSATARSVISRVYSKLNGTDFRPRESLDVQGQVERLIQEATSHENLAQCFVGWCPFW